MRTLSKMDLAELLQKRDGPCISLYQPTHRQHPENRQDPIRFKNLLKQAAEFLRNKYPSDSMGELLEPLHALAEDADFWNHTSYSMAVFRAKDFFRVYTMLRPTKELGVISESFHVKPLKRYLHTADRFQILCINREQVKLYEGNRDYVEALTLHENVPSTIEQALGGELTDAHITVASYNGPKYATPNMYHGHGSKKDELDTDIERFFRVIDKAILQYHSQPSELPLVLAALPEYHHLFNEVSQNTFLIKKDGIKINPFALDEEKLREHAWRVVEPQYLEKIKTAIENFQIAQSKGLGSDDVRTIAKATAEGRVSLLLTAEGQEIPGQLYESGSIKFRAIEDPEADDLSDDLAERVMQMGGDVLVIPTEQMPTSTGLAATYRY